VYRAEAVSRDSVGKKCVRKAYWGIPLALNTVTAITVFKIFLINRFKDTIFKNNVGLK
jgi:hypothetical protein